MENSSRSLASTVAAGDETQSLTALRDRLALEIDACESARDVAALSARLVDVLERISAVKKPTESKVDEIAKRRAERRATATAG